MARFVGKGWVVRAGLGLDWQGRQGMDDQVGNGRVGRGLVGRGKAGGV